MTSLHLVLIAVVVLPIPILICYSGVKWEKGFRRDTLAARRKVDSAVPGSEDWYKAISEWQDATNKWSSRR